uniref:Anthranilate synthase component 2 n=1 Tax=Nitophyllum punctatum TaxID=158729 RepID=A0A4D6WWT3_9FLOR|nr:Anthranilate synthase component II [Nitophyllum punctatum]
MIVIIDNYDSFTQNLVQYVGISTTDIQVVRNDEIKLNKLRYMNPTHIILSPGPGSPQDSGICLDIISQYADKIPILGVCLGHQSIGYAYGAEIKILKKPMHGKISYITHDEKDLFYQLPNQLKVARYHSLVINNHKLPKNIEITAQTNDGIIMGCRHKIHKSLRGLQFHPESLWTDKGKEIINNFLLS